MQRQTAIRTPMTTPSRARSGLATPLVLAAALGLVLAAAASGAAEEPDQRWEQLSTATIGADQFLASHPQWDGRGVLIAVCDSGVELGLRGLSVTTEGEPKIMEAREMSSEGRIKLEPARREDDEQGTAYRPADSSGPYAALGGLYGAETLSPAPAEGAEVLIGFFEEHSWQTSEVTDLNNNGEADDVFGLVTYRPEGAGDDDPWIGFLDTDGDGDLADEQPLRDFGVAQEAFTLGGNDPRTEAPRITYALNLWPAERTAALYFDGNGHGTHVAGTAAGYHINGQEGYNGIAPGAQILAYKIGNNSLAGGATTAGSMLSAWRQAIEKAEKLGKPLVIQMSYGIGSEDEGKATAERLIDELLREHPGVVATLSAGNDGPGTSTIGLPAAADEVLAVGAAFARTTAEIVYGISWTQDRIFPFSARGAELAKPDMMAPGFEASTVPPWAEGDVFRGTSMASPQGAGACALLMSAALANDLPVRRDLVRAAIQRTARQIPGYGPLDQGPGMIDLPRAWEAYKVLARRDPHDPLRYRVTTASPELASGSGSTVFYRDTFFPRGDETQDVTIEAVFPKDTPDAFIRDFYRGLDIETDAEWVHVDKPSTYLRQDGKATIPLRFDADALIKPGLYQARALLFDRSLSRADRRLLGPELMIPVAVMVPIDLDHGPFQHRSRLEAVAVDRMPIRVEPWTGTISIEVELPRAERDREVMAVLHDPEGRRSYLGRLDAASPTLSHVIPARQLETGVYELALWGRQSNRGPVEVLSTITSARLMQLTSESLSLAHPSGHTPTGSLELTWLDRRTWRGKAKASVVGVVRTRSQTISSLDQRIPMMLAPEEKALNLELEIDRSDWKSFTDVAVQMLDHDGAAKVQTGFSYRLLKLELGPHEGAEQGAAYSLQIVSGIADPDAGSPSWPLSLREVHRYSEPVAAKVSQHGADEIVLYPDHQATLELDLKGTPPQPPDGFTWLIELELVPDDSRQPGLELDLEAQ